MLFKSLSSNSCCYIIVSYIWRCLLCVCSERDVEASHSSDHSRFHISTYLLTLSCSSSFLFVICRIQKHVVSCFSTVIQVDCKKPVVGYWHGYLCGARCRLAYGPADATATHCLTHTHTHNRLTVFCPGLPG